MIIYDVGAKPPMKWNDKPFEAADTAEVVWVITG
jgi:hypothetical protein